jgi:hypothetical protein
VALAVLALTLASGCSERERINPLDPSDPGSSTASVGFLALAGNAEVFLTWNPLQFEDVAGVSVMRTLETGEDTVVLNDSLLPPNALNFLDQTAQNDITYSYRLRFALKNSAEKPVTYADLATPGRLVSWMTVNDYEGVVRMTPDFRDKRYSLETGFYDVLDIQIKPDNSEIWVLDGGSSQIRRFYPTGDLAQNQGDLGQVAAFRFNQFDHSLWIADFSLTSTLYHIGSSGQILGSYKTGFLPTTIALDYPGGGAWLGGSDNRIIMIQDNAVIQISHSDFVRPELIASGVSSSTAWALDTEAKSLFHLTGDKVDWKKADFANPVDLATDIEGSVCWVADLDADLVYGINADMTVFVRVKGLGGPLHVTYNRFDHTILVTGNNGLISSVSEGGQVLWQVKNLERPGLIALQVFD